MKLEEFALTILTHSDSLSQSLHLQSCLAEVASLAILAVVITTLVIANITDYKTHRISNRLLKWSFAIVMPMLFLIHFTTEHSTFWVSNIPEATAGASTVFAIMFVFWLLGGVGGGDVKLMTLIGLVVGAGRGLNVLLIALACAVVFIVCRRILQFVLLPKEFSKSSQPVAMAGFFSVAVIIVLAGSFLQ